MSKMLSNDEIEPCLTAVMPVYNEAADRSVRDQTSCWRSGQFSLLCHRR